MIFRLINSLTTDEDRRQDLWVHYLSGNEPSTFVKFLQDIKVDHDKQQELQATIWQLISDDSHSKLLEILNHFSEFERELIVLLMMGFSIHVIAGYKGTTSVRIKQAISNVKSNEKWKEIC